jgi:hypothetical protein
MATSTPHPNPPQPVTDALKQTKVTATRKTVGLKKPEPKSTAVTKPAAGKCKKKTAAGVKTAVAKLTTSDLVAPTSPFEEISDLDRRHLQVCVRLTRRLLTSISPPHRAARPRAVLKTVILFVAEYGSTP